MRIINFDNAATTQPLPYVQEAVAKFLNSYGSVHRGSGENSKVSTKLYEQARDYIITYCQPSTPSYALFTQNTTGAMSMAAYFFSKIQGKIAVSNYEHSSSTLPFVKAEGEVGLGQVSLSSLALDDYNKCVQDRGLNQVLTYDLYNPLRSLKKSFLENEIKLLVITASSNLTGYTPPIRAMADIAHAHGAMVLLDACQYIPHHPISMRDLDVDFLAASGHKTYAPYGAGFLIAPKKFSDAFLPYQLGGGNLPYIGQQGIFLDYRYHSNQAHDPGTPNAVGVVAMAAALKKLLDVGFCNIERKEKELTHFIFDELNKMPNVVLYVSKQHLGSIISFNVKTTPCEVIARRLNDEYGISVRAGNFCVYNAVRSLLKQHDARNRLLLSQGKPLPGVVRASINFLNTMEEAETFVSAIKELSNG